MMFTLQRRVFSRLSGKWCLTQSQNLALLFTQLGCARPMCQTFAGKPESQSSLGESESQPDALMLRAAWSLTVISPFYINFSGQHLAAPHSCKTQCYQCVNSGWAPPVLSYLSWKTVCCASPVWAVWTHVLRAQNLVSGNYLQSYFHFESHSRACFPRARAASTRSPCFMLFHPEELICSSVSLRTGLPHLCKCPIKWEPGTNPTSFYC